MGMKKTILLLALASIAVLLASGVALAATLRGTNGNDNITGTRKSDIVHGLGGNDILGGGKGSDVIFHTKRLRFLGRSFIRCKDLLLSISPKSWKERLSPGIYPEVESLVGQFTVRFGGS